MAARQSISIGGSTHWVHTSLPDEDLARLSAKAEARLRELLPKGKLPKPETFMLVALSFVHDAELAAAATTKAEARAAEAEQRAAEAEHKATELEDTLDEELEKRRALEAETRDVLRRVLSRIDLALEDDEDDPAPASPT